MSRPRCLVFVAASAALLMFAGWLLWAPSQPTASPAKGVYGLILLNGFALGSAATAGLRSRGPQRVSWLCLATGIAGVMAGDLISAYVGLTTGTRLPFPSPVDALYLLLPVSVIAAAVFAPVRGMGSGIRTVLDGVIVSASLFVIAWAVGLDQVYQEANAAFLTFAVSLAFPIAYLALLAMIVVFLVRAPAAARLSAILLMAGLFVITITNSAVVFWTLNPPQDDGRVIMGWATGVYLVGVAGLWSNPSALLDAEPRRTATRTSWWLLPYVPVPLALVLGTLELRPPGHTVPILVGGIIVVASTLLRQFILLAENRRLLATVTDMALRDPLTDLANRTLFTDRLAHAMQLRLRKSAPLAVLLLDLDDFKLINDSFGHPAGDALLRSVGERIQGSLRDGDTVARLGGDEYAVLIEDDTPSAYAVAEAVVTAFNTPFAVDGREVFVRPSVGLAIAPAVGDEDLTADDLFRRADLAMYSAKRTKFHGVRAFTPGMRLAGAEVHGIDRIQLLGDLRHAIDNDELALVYQPKFNLATGTVVGVEALIRWPHPTLGTLGPADFLPLVRQNGLMDAVTALVLARAVREAAGWYAAGTEIPVAINLSATSLDDQALPDRLLAVLAEYGMPADSLSVEITEDVLLASIARTRIVLDRLRQNGIRVAIDDFGSGYAAMTYLRELPVDEIKLERQFVAPIVRDPRAAAIVESVIDLAETFGIACVAEGVEDKATADRLKEYGCGYAQGHYFSPPVPAEAISLGVWGPQPAATRPSSA